MFYYHWLLKEAASGYSKAEYSQAGSDMQRAAESKGHHVAAEGERPRGKI